MTQFIQLHALVSYAPANLNRDDLGRPKSARMGGVMRMRVSSQSLKRAWRISEVFSEVVSNKQPTLPAIVELFGEEKKGAGLGIRTRSLSETVCNRLRDAGITSDSLAQWQSIFSVALGEASLKKSSDVEDESEGGDSDKSTILFLSDFEVNAFVDVAKQLKIYMINPEGCRLADQFKHLMEHYEKAKKADTKQKKTTALKNLSETLYGMIRVRPDTAADVAMFGRMLAINPNQNIDAAVQVAHAISVHEVVTDDDYFTAVDELNKTGAAHIGESYFGAAVLYLYVCIDRDQLKRNLGGDETLTQRAISALTQTMLTVGPTGKQNSHASRAYAHYALVEKGAQQPRQLSLAFLKPVGGGNYPEDATRELRKLRDNMDKVYGACADKHYEINAYTGEGSVAELIKFSKE